MAEPAGASDGAQTDPREVGGAEEGGAPAEAEASTADDAPEVFEEWKTECVIQSLAYGRPGSNPARAMRKRDRGAPCAAPCAPCAAPCAPPCAPCATRWEGRPIRATARRSLFVASPSKLGAFAQLVPRVFSTYLRLGTEPREALNSILLKNAFDERLEYAIAPITQSPNHPDHPDHPITLIALLT